MNNKYLYVLILMLTIVVTILLYRSRTLSTSLSDAQHNINVMKDSVRTLTLTTGQQLSTIGSYILKKNELEEYLNISNKRIKELEKQVGKLAYISDIQTVIKYDSIFVKDTIRYDSPHTILYDIDYSDNWLTLHGWSKVYLNDNTHKTGFEQISMNVPLQVGLTDDYRIWVTSENPYLKVTDIKGAVVSGSALNKKQKKWGLGINTGIGLTYDLCHKQFGYGPYFGVGLHYNILSW